MCNVMVQCFPVSAHNLCISLYQKQAHKDYAEFGDEIIGTTAILDDDKNGSPFPNRSKRSPMTKMTSNAKSNLFPEFFYIKKKLSCGV